MTRPDNPPELWLRRFPAPAAGPAGAGPAGAVQAAAEPTLRLVCLPHAGGAATFFRPLAQALAPTVEVLAVQYPGRQDRYREPPIDNLPELADRTFAALAGIVHSPLALFGHSMGAVVAYEVALRMRRDVLPPPVRLFASGRRAPSRYRDENVHRRSEAGVVAELRRLGGTDPRMLGDPDVVELVMRAVRTDYRAIETYRHQPDVRLDCPVTVLAGDRDPMVTLDEARDWQRHTTEPIDLRVLPGGHFLLADDPAAVVEAIAGRLAAVPSPSRPG
jgi:surfactin synthase thioesterase subunit